jgi:hypothetical protein
MIVFQAIDRSFEIHSSLFIGDESYTFWDAKKEDLLRDRRDNSIVYFPNVSDAIARSNGIKIAKADLSDTRNSIVVERSNRKGKAPNPESALSTMKRLITENVLKDEEILVEVQKIASGYKHVSIVRHTRKKMGL